MELEKKIKQISEELKNNPMVWVEYQERSWIDGKWGKFARYSVRGEYLEHFLLEEIETSLYLKEDVRIVIRANKNGKILYKL